MKPHENPIILPERTNASVYVCVCLCVFLRLHECVDRQWLIKQLQRSIDFKQVTVSKLVCLPQSSWMFQILLAIKCHKLQACQQTRPTVQTTLDSKVSSLQQQDSDHLNAQIVIGQVRTAKARKKTTTTGPSSNGYHNNNNNNDDDDADDNDDDDEDDEDDDNNDNDDNDDNKDNDNDNTNKNKNENENEDQKQMPALQQDAARSMSCPQVHMKSPSLFPSPDPYRHRRCAKLYIYLDRLDR